MVEQRNDLQYSDDDLTIDRLDSEPLDPSVVDLFEYLGDESSPIGRLKALVLSIDWEITDEVLRDFNEELASLREIWGGDPIKVVYLQALEKISKYIYQAQSDAHPDAIKLLPLLFVNLEKIVQGGRKMSEDAKKQLLSRDVRRFNRLKAQILARNPSQLAASGKSARVPQQMAIGNAVGSDGVMAINRLKALILGIDWEITEKDLMALRREVLHLEDIFASSRPKQLFLQGIGTLSAYIRNKKSNAHADAFSLLHDFFAGLEKVVTERLDFSAEKVVLLSLVSRFNAFKETIAATLSAEAIAKSKQAVLEEEAKEEEEIGSFQPAFADLPEDVHGFRLEEEAVSPDMPQAVFADIEKFFIEEDGLPLARAVDDMGLRDSANDTENLFDQSTVAEPVAVAPEVALRGINVETEADDDSGEAALPRQGGQLAPALSDEPVLPYGETVGVSQVFPAESEIPEEISSRLDDFFSTFVPPASLHGSTGETRDVAFTVSSDAALQGVNVDSDTDDESEKDEPAPFLSVHSEKEKEPAPALVDVDASESALDTDEEEVEFSVDAELTPALSFLPDDEPEVLKPTESDEIAPALSDFEDEIAPALADFDDVELPERSEFSEGELKDGAAPSLDNEELLAFFADKFSDDQDGKATSTAVAEKPERRVIEEAELLEVPQQLDDQERDDFITFLAVDETSPELTATDMDVKETIGDIAFLSDAISSPVAAEPVADAEPKLSLSDEAELFVDDFFADQTDAAPGIAESAVPDSMISRVDDEAMAGAGLSFADIPGVDVDDHPGPVVLAATAEDAETAEDSTPAFFGDISLRDCVDALSEEINDDILEQSYHEVRRLRMELDKQPLAGMYLQFISTIMQHIDRRRADASDEALPLLRQTLAHLEDSRRGGGDVEKIQQSLFNDAQAVLSWQQSLLHQESDLVVRSWLS